MSSTNRTLGGPFLVLILSALLVTPLFITAAGQAEDEDRVEIIRDQYGVPHVYGETAEDVSYGAGYALAQDRLWQMHLFRLIGEGRLSEFLGPLVVETDKGIRFLTYTEEEREERFETYPEEIQANTEAFAEGITDYIHHVEQNPDKIPFEFVEYGLWPIEDWEATDSVALQDVLILSFGAGGGDEIEHLALLDRLVEEHGLAKGQAMFDDLVPTLDEDAEPTVPRGYDYENEPTYAREAEAQARRALEDDARLGGAGHEATVELPELGPEPASHMTPAAKGTLEQLRLVADPETHLANMEPVEQARELLHRVFSFGSNAQIVGPSQSETGNAMQTGGPQVGYLLPQWLADVGLHSEDGPLDATGMTFAGAGPAVLIGRGPGYAWTTTTGSSDLMDTYIETLNPEDPKEYLFNGAWEEMSCRQETYAFRGVEFDSQEICRTRHGPVVSIDEENDQAVSLRYGWFNREGQTVEGFFAYNKVDSVEDFATFSNYLASNHNMFYTDDQGNYGYWHPGNFPDRADGIDIRLPQDGTGGSEWQGLIPIQQTPHAVNFERGWLGNWNNMPAEGWEREQAFDPIDNADDLYRTLNTSQPAVPDPFGGLVNPDRALDYEDLNGNLRYAAFKDHQDTHFRPFLPASADVGPLAQQALAHVQAWDGFLDDRDGDGLYHSGTTIIDAWVEVMEDGAFQDDLGPLAGEAGSELLWHVLNDEDRFTESFDWLGGEPVDAFTARTFETAVADLAERFDSQDPADWQEPTDKEHYQRLNADLVTDIATGSLGFDNSQDSGVPGDVADHIEMDRGTYNHIVAYQTPPTGSGQLGEAVAKAGSVIPPGQSGYISLTGQEDEHYEDQLELYVDWEYKPMPLTRDQSLDLAESQTFLDP